MTFSLCIINGIWWYYSGSKTLVGIGLLMVEVSRSHSDTPHLVGLLRTVISPSQRPLLDNTHSTHKTDIHASGGIRTHSPNKRTATDPRLRPRGHCDRQKTAYSSSFTSTGPRSSAAAPRTSQTCLALH